jgi:hypothetical protein
MRHQRKNNDTHADQERAQGSSGSAMPVSASAEHISYLQRTVGNRAASYLITAGLKNSRSGEPPPLGSGPVIQRLSKGGESASTAATPAAEAGETLAGMSDRAVTPARALIVEDEAPVVEPGQMRRSEFLDQLHASTCGAAEEALAGTMWSAMGCPYLDRWFGYYSGQSSQHIERALHKYAPETAGASSAGEYITIVTHRLRRGIEQWSETGEITGVPEELAQGGAPEVTAQGLMGGMVSGALSAAGGAVSEMGGMLFKGREGAAREAEDPEAIQSQLGSGHSLDGDVKARMESAFGADFSGVRIHTDAKAQDLSDGLNARAFTIGRDVAFGPGEYEPGTLIGDALIAHELAHVTQQRGTSSGAPFQKGGAERDSLEEDADVAAVGAVVSVWGGAKGSLAEIGRNATPRMRSGLKLQRCDNKKTEEKKDVNADPKLLTDFAGKFPDAADLIRKSDPAMKLVREAAAAGVKFGGHVEEAAGKDIGRAHTSGDKVYVPKSQTDKVMAMRDFLFELNNAIRAPKFAELTQEAVKGSGGKLTANEFAYKMAEQEVEGMLRLGQVWFEMKKTIGADAEWNKYDNYFFLSEYQAFKEGKKTKDDVVKNVLKRTYDTGTLSGKTVEQYYMDEYKRVSGGK